MRRAYLVVNAIVGGLIVAVALIFLIQALDNWSTVQEELSNSAIYDAGEEAYFEPPAVTAVGVGLIAVAAGLLVCWSSVRAWPEGTDHRAEGPQHGRSSADSDGQQGDG